MQSRLVLIRHGQVESPWRGKIYGSHEVELSPWGREQARQAALRVAHVTLAAVISSPLSRAHFGAEQLCQNRSVEHLVDADLREIERGQWIGIEVERLGADGGLTHEEWLQAPHKERPPGGENLTDLAQRVLPRLDHWATRFPGQTVGVVAHSWVIRVALCSAMGLPLSQAVHLQLDTGAMCALEWAAQEPDSGQGSRRCLVGLGLQRLPERRPWFSQPAR